MNLKQANVLITGGSDGIGLGLATRFLNARSRVLITGRNEERLLAAKQEFPGLEILVHDIGVPAERERLVVYVQKSMSEINVLINNAGIQRRVALAADDAPWADRQAEMNILLAAPVHLNHLLIPTMLKQKRQAVIVNVTSGGAYVPQVFAPIYSACKAALHSYTMTLRHALSGTNCRVIELIPPAVQTKLAGAGLNHGVSLDAFCDSVFEGLVNSDEIQIGYRPTNNLVQQINGRPLSELFSESLARFPVEIY